MHPRPPSPVTAIRHALLLPLAPALLALATPALPTHMATAAPGVDHPPVRMEITQQIDFADGASFGDSGPYQRIDGRLHFEADPDHPAYAAVNDLHLAPRNEHGRVEFWTDFSLLLPAEPERGNGRLLYDVNNRGNKLALWTFNRDSERTNDPLTADHAGDGFLMELGYAILWCGWNGEVIEDGGQRLLTGLPIARNPDGSPVTGPAHLEFSTTERVHSREFSWSPWGISAAYPPADPDPAAATLTKRRDRGSPAIEIPSTDWAYARWEDGRKVPDPASLYLEEGFEPGWLYDLVYTATDPRVTGLGLAALRDCVAFFRHAEADIEGRPNPLHGAIDHAYAFGISQSGRVVHHFIHDGFNTDAHGRQVFDGALIHVAGAGKGMFNHRFRMTTEYGSVHEGRLSGSEFFPLAPVMQTDPLTGEQGGTLTRARENDHVPRMLFVQSSTEYWNRGASLLHTDVLGTTDLELPEEIRLYLVAGAQHLGGGDRDPGPCQQPRNPLDDRGPVLRALLVALDRWVAHDEPPPPSRHPRIDDGTLVDLATFTAAFPVIPGVNLPFHHHQPGRLDFGPRFHSEGIADIVPPIEGEPYVTLLPAVDDDGNEIAGIRLPEVAVPDGTYTGWNLMAADHGIEGVLSRLDGMHLPFALDEEERAATGDPRPSVTERYPDAAAYVDAIEAAAAALQAERLMLPEDAARIIQRAQQRAATWFDQGGGGGS